MGEKLFPIVRAVTIAAMVFFIAMFFLNLALAPGYAAAELQNWTPNITWTSEAVRAALAELGWSPLAVVYFFTIVLPLIAGVINIGLGLLILSRKSQDWFGLFVAFVFVLVGTNSASSEPLIQQFPALIGLYKVVGVVSWQLTFILFYLFPDGHFVPRWTRWLLLGWLGVNILGLYTQALDPIVLVVTLLLVASTLVSQVYRYFRYADAVGRQQTKWIFYAVLLFIILLPILLLPFIAPALFLENGTTGLFWALVLRTLGTLTNLFPIAIAIAILRYRFWDIDVIIQRTLTYALVTGLLLVVFFGSVILLQRLFAGLTGSGQNEIVTVLSTLAIAALFVPVRNWIQNAIDKRFNRKKYDAQKVLSDFANTVRDETDLEKLTARLMQVVDETMEPKSMSLWLKRTGEGKRQKER